MYKVMILTTIFLSLGAFVYAGGEAETGRDQAMDEVGAGQLLPIGAIDSATYLSDFAYEQDNTGINPLEINVDLLQDSFWDRGNLTAMRIALASAQKPVFERVSGNYIIYVQNPELLRNLEFTNFLTTQLAGYDLINSYFYDHNEEELIKADSRDEISEAISKLNTQAKSYSNTIVLQKLLSTVRKASLDRTHILWITDENIVEERADANFFEFSIRVLGTSNTTFSYLAYGEVPNWTILNRELMEYNGNSYYADNIDEIKEKLGNDIEFFNRPAIEDINIRIILEPGYYEAPNFYPEPYYPPIEGFRAIYNNNRPSSSHSLGGMNYGEVKRYLHYINIPPISTIQNSLEFGEPMPERMKIATVYIDYFVPMDDRRYFLQQDVEYEYKRAEQYVEQINQFVLADTIIQNTPLVIQEVAYLVNHSRNYLAAIQLIIVQRNLLESITNIREDEAIAEDLELLDEYYNLLFEQAKVINRLE